MKFLSKIRTKLASVNILKPILLYSSIVLFGCYIFSIGAFSGRVTFNLISIAIGVVMIALMLFYVVIFGKLKLDLFSMLLVNFFLAFMISNVVNFSFDFPKSVGTQVLMGLAFYQFFSNIEKKKMKILAPLVVAGGLLFLLRFAYEYRADIIKLEFGNRLGAFFDNENEVAKEFGYFAIVSFCCGLYLNNIFTIKRKGLRIAIRVVFFLVSVLFVFGILTTGSISNILTFLLVVLIASFFKLKKKKSRIIYALFIVASLIGFVCLIQIPSLEYFKNRLMKMFNTFIHGGQGGDASSNLRLYALIQYIQLFFQKPLFGFGYGQGKMYTAYNMVSHSSIAELLTCTGLFGCLSFEIMLIYALYKTFKKRDETFISFVLMYVLIFQIFISSTYHAKLEYVFLAVAYSTFKDDITLKDIGGRIKELFNKIKNEDDTSEVLEIEI